MAILGADVEQLESLARTMAKAGDAFDQSFVQIREGLYRANWTGPSADRFRSEWASHGKGLRAAHDALEKLASRLLQEAAQQLAASGGGGRNSVPGTSTGGSGSSPFNWLSGIQEFSRTAGPGTSTTAAPPAQRLGVESILAPLEAQIPNLLLGASSLDDLKPSASTLLNQLNSKTAEVATSFDASKEWSFQKAGDVPWGTYSIDAQAGIGAEGSFSATAGFRNGQIHGDFNAALRLGAYAELSANTDLLGFVPVGIRAEAMAGAEADIAGAMALGMDGVQANLSGGGFAGARASAEGGLNLGGYGDATAGGEAWAGVGVEGGADADLGWDRVGLKTEFGIGLGVGAKFSFDVGFSPKGLFNGISDFGSNLSDVGINDVARAFANTPVVGDIADKAVSAATGAIAGAGRSAFKAVGGLFG